MHYEEHEMRAARGREQEKKCVREDRRFLQGEERFDGEGIHAHVAACFLTLSIAEFWCSHGQGCGLGTCMSIVFTHYLLHIQNILSNMHAAGLLK